MRLPPVVAAALTLCACDVRPAAYAEQPPERFRHDATVRVSFVSNVQATCLLLGAKREPGKELRGCERDGLLVLPNPCRWPNASDLREVGCHELGHANGWPADHPH